MDYLKSPDYEGNAEWESEVNRRSATYTRWVQQALNKVLGLRLTVDGVIGPATRSAIRSFQQKHGLAADGIPGPRTEQALIQAGAPSIAGNNIVTMPQVTITSMPCKTLDNFDFNSSRLKPAHIASIDVLAKRIVASYSTSRPIRTVYTKGHTDPVGTPDYNQALGLRRALSVRKQLMKSLNRVRRYMSARVLILASSRGEKDAKFPSPAQNRRVEVCLSTKQLQPRRPKPKPKPLPTPHLIPLDPNIKIPTLPIEDPCEERDKRLRGCKTDYFACLAKSGASKYVERIKKLAPSMPECFAAIESGNVIEILQCALNMGQVEIDAFIKIKEALEDCRGTYDRCKHYAIVNTRDCKKG